MPAVEIAIDARKAQEGGSQAEQSFLKVAKSVDQLEQKLQETRKHLDAFYSQSGYGGSGYGPVVVTRQQTEAVEDLDKATKNLAATSDTTASKIRDNLAGQLRDLAAPVAGLFAIREAVRAVGAAFARADEVGKFSEKVGISVEQLSALVNEAQFANVGAEALKTGIVHLSSTLVEAARGGEEATKALASFGLGTNLLAETGGDTLKVLERIADIFASLPDGAEKAAAAVKLFGRSGPDLIPFLNAGGSGIGASVERAIADGRYTTAEAAKAASEFSDSVSKLKQSFDSFLTSFTPAVEVLTGIVSGASVALDLGPNGREQKHFEQLERFRKGQILSPDDGAGLARDLQRALEAEKAEAAQAEAAAKSHAEFAAAIRDLDRQIAELDAEPLIAQVRDANEAVGEYVQKLREENDILLLSGQAQEEAIAIREAERIARQYGFDLTQKEIESIRDEVAIRHVLMESIDDTSDAREREAEAQRARAAQQQFGAVADLAEYLAAIRQETDLLRLEGPERDRQIALLKAEELARKAGIDLTDEDIRQINAEFDIRELLTASIDDNTEALRKYQDEQGKILVNGQEMISQIHIEAETMGLSADERERVQAVMELNRRTEGLEIDSKRELNKQLLVELDNRQRLTRVRQFSDQLADDVTNIADRLSQGWKDWQDVAKQAILDVGHTFLETFALKPLQQSLSSLFFGAFSGSSLFSERGNVFASGNVVPFANGGVTTGPSYFPMRSGRIGVAGEAGPEAIMPLQRGPDGKLGVAANGGTQRTVNLTLNIYGQVGDGTRRSSQQLGRDLKRQLESL